MYTLVFIDMIKIMNRYQSQKNISTMYELRIYIQGYKYFKTLKTNKRIIYINSGLIIPSSATLLMGKKGFDLLKT